MNLLHGTELMKRCSKCGKYKPLDEFYRHLTAADGHFSKCKECAKSDTSRNYRKNKLHYIAYEKKRAQRPKRKVLASKYQHNTRKNNPDRYRATYLLNNAVRSGKVTPTPCEVCGSLNVEAHHPDYSKPLDVQWLCRTHHLQKHNKVSYTCIMEMLAREDEQKTDNTQGELECLES